jgi:hypothetical protein
VVDARLFVVSHRVIYYAEVYVSKELSCNVCYLLVFLVVFNSLVKVFRVLFAHFHKVDADAVVCKGLAVDITNRSTNLKEFFVLINCRLVLAEIVVKNAC